MRIKILQSEILPALQAVARSTGVKSSLPVLANILFQAEGSNLTLSATNLEIGIVKTISAKVEEEGAITVPARTLLEIISSLPGVEITLEATQDQLKLATPNFNASLNGIASSEFPAIPLSSEQSISIKGSILGELLPQITFAAAVDEGRPILTGILTEIKNGKLELVATDGFRLAHCTASTESSEKINFRSLIPRRTFEEVVRLISEELKEGEMVEISTSENQNQMIFKMKNTELSSRLIEGQFPVWEKIIPTNFENNTILDRQELIKAVKLASVFAKDAANIIKLETQQGKIKLTSEAKELGGQETLIDAKIEGSPIIIAFNSKYLLDALNACPSQEIVIQFSGSLSPSLLKPFNSPNEDLQYVIMPIRLS